MLNPVAKKQLHALLSDPHCAGTTMVALCFDLFGSEFLEWDPLILREAISAQLQFDLTPAQNDRLHTAMSMLTDDRFETDYLFYAHACEALGGSTLEPAVHPEPSPEDMAWANAEFELLTGDAPQFSDEIRAYQGVCLVDHGLHHAPNTLTSAVLPESPESAIADDPEMYRAWAERELKHVDHVDAHVRDRVSHLLSALDRIPLSNRDTESWLKLIQQAGQPNG